MIRFATIAATAWLSAAWLGLSAPAPAAELPPIPPPEGAPAEEAPPAEAAVEEDATPPDAALAEEAPPPAAEAPPDELPPIPAPEDLPPEGEAAAEGVAPAEPPSHGPAEAEPPAPSGAGSDAQFFAELGFKDVASAADTARALVIFVSEGRRGGGDFEADQRYLQGAGVTSRWLRKAQPTRPTSKGQLAALLCRALDVEGGMWMRLLGPVPRAALRECVYLELMTGGAEYKHVSGGELVGVIDRADRFRLREAGKAPPKLEEEPLEEPGG